LERVCGARPAVRRLRSRATGRFPRWLPGRSAGWPLDARGRTDRLRRRDGPRRAVRCAVRTLCQVALVRERRIGGYTCAERTLQGLRGAVMADSVHVMQLRYCRRHSGLYDNSK
jgi:hypothetical protein